MNLKRFWKRLALWVGLLLTFITILLCLHYMSMGQPFISSKETYNSRPNLSARSPIETQKRTQNLQSSKILNSSLREIMNPKYQWGKCYFLNDRPTNITTLQEYTKFDFEPKKFWDESLETKFNKQNKSKSRPPLKIIVVPHSHIDPGWLKTFLDYFHSDSRQILNHIVTKMQEYTDMTFIWTEISFLQLWWDQAHQTKKEALKQLVQSGRFEITTGGWVMTDEANVHLYAMIDQLIEGHQWLRVNLNVTPEVGWSINPFGHGSTLPYLLSASNFEGTIIQRIHYAWKEWFAKNQSGDFFWSPFWKTEDDTSKTHSLLTHNMPFNLYNIKDSCGPDPASCLNFDFRQILDEYNNYFSRNIEFITDGNIAEKAHIMLQQYSRTASHFPHNVALMPVGDDFRYNNEREVDQQYTSYKQLIDYINANKDIYNAEISFGTPKDYFKEIKKKRHSQFPTLKGDFFVYSDIYEDKPAYWSGYFTTRPFYKILSNDLEHNLRSAEILFTMAFNIARQRNQHNALKFFEMNYEKIILARRNLGLFQHHDAITGTSKEPVMQDYGIRLFESILNVENIQESTIELLTQDGTNVHNFIFNELERESYDKVPRKTPISIDDNNDTHFIMYNSLAQERLEVIVIRTLRPNIKIFTDNGREVNFQINPVWNVENNYKFSNVSHMEKIIMSTKQFEVLFVAKLPPLSLVKYKIVKSEIYEERMATIHCNKCNENGQNKFPVRKILPNDIQLSNFQMRLWFDENSGFLKAVSIKNVEKPIKCDIKFSAYKSYALYSGAYLFKTYPEKGNAEKDVFKDYNEMRIVITSGLIASDLTVIYGPFLSHTVRIFHTQTDLDKAIYIENYIDFEQSPKNSETELFMRFMTQIENGKSPEIFTDQNGFQFHRRIKIPSIGIEGNYYPITTSAFIQDSKLRLTLITTHAQGTASLESGQLEVMLDRRSSYDDSRGLGEGVTDNRLTRHKFWLTIEEISPKKGSTYQVPSLFVNHLANILRYPSNIYFIKNTKENISNSLKNRVLFLKQPLPCDVNLLNLRTQTDDQLSLLPTRSAFMVLHRQGYDCSIGDYISFCNDTRDFSDDLFNELNIKYIEQTGLTGLKAASNIDSFQNVQLEPMELKTLNFTFIF